MKFLLAVWSCIAWGLGPKVRGQDFEQRQRTRPVIIPALVLAMLLGLVVSAEATPGFFRRTPARPFVGPRFVPVAPSARVFDPHFNSRAFDPRFSSARDFGIRGDVLVQRTFRDRFGRLRVGLFDSRGRLVEVID